LDADDVSESNRLAEQLAFVAAHPEIDVLGSQLTIIDDKGQIIARREYAHDHESICRLMRRYNAMGQSAVLMRRQLVVDAGGYLYRRRRCAEDYELWSRLLKLGARFANHPAALVRYRIHGAQTKVTALREHLLATIDIKQMFWRSQFDIRDRLHYWGEHGLGLMPNTLVLTLFQALQYRRVQ
jgi:hypothetical protein